MRPIWEGAISFGLISIPIKLYSAVEPKSFSFKLLHRKDKSRIRFKRFCEKEGKEVKLQDIAKGVEVTKNHYYLITPEELEKLKPEKSEFIDIMEFIETNQIDPIYFNSHYFIAPSRQNDKAFFLFRDVLQLSNKTAIGKFVFKNKEYACTIRGYRNGLLLTTLNYQYEIRDIGNLEELKTAPKIRDEELDLAKKLIQQLTKEEFNMTKFTDSYEVQLKNLIRKKEKGEPIIISNKPKEGKEEDILTALRASLKK